MKKFFKIFVQIIFVLLIISVSFILITSRTSVWGIHSYTVVTGSMEPTIHTGSIVFTSPSSSYNVGDIVTFNRGNITITHRIVASKGKQFQTKGDANKIDDAVFVNKNDIIGKDILIIPYLGKITSLVKTIPGFILIVALPILIFVCFEILNIKKEFEKEIEKKVMKKIHSLEEKL